MNRGRQGGEEVKNTGHVEGDTEKNNACRNSHPLLRAREHLQERSYTPSLGGTSAGEYCNGVARLQDKPGDAQKWSNNRRWPRGGGLDSTNLFLFSDLGKLGEKELLRKK